MANELNIEQVSTGGARVRRRLTPTSASQVLGFNSAKALVLKTHVDTVLSATATLDFPSTAAQTSSELTIAVPGAAVGMPAVVASPAATPANSICKARVTAADTVTVRFNNYSSGAIDPASASYTVVVFKL